MKVIHKLTVHLDDRHIMPCIDAVQADAYTRVLELTLYSGAVAWNVPDGVSVAVAYDGASGKGIYNTLPDGSAACAVDGNVVTAVVVPQALSMPGETKLTVVFTDGNGGQLAAFCVTLKVEKNPAVGASGPSDYINMRQWMTAELPVLLEEMGVGTFYTVDVFPAGNGYATEEKFADILEADKASKTVVCELELNSEQAYLLLPLVKRSDTAVHFSAVLNGEELRVEIDAEDKLTFYREPVGGSAEVDATVKKVYIEGNATEGYYIADGVIDDVQTAYENGYLVVCEIRDLCVVMPLSKIEMFESTSGWIFSTVISGVEYQAEIGITLMSEVGKDSYYTSFADVFVSSVEMDATLSVKGMAADAAAVGEALAECVKVAEDGDVYLPCVALLDAQGEAVAHTDVYTDDAGQPVVELWGSNDDENVRLGHLADGVEDDDAVNVKQLREAFGVSVVFATVEQTDTGATVTISDKNGTTTAVIANGEKGEKGDTGAQGPQGIQGEQGETGAAGADGYTPVKGVDYYTEADKAELVELVLATLPDGTEVAY